MNGGGIEFMDASSVELPTRCSLYSLNTPSTKEGQPESLTSYIARLADAHCVSTWALVRFELAPRLLKDEATLRSRAGEFMATTGAALNGENETSRKCVEALQELTGRDDLSKLTMQFCGGYLSSRYLVRVHQAWCPICLSEWSKYGRLIYWPLLWQLLAVEVCPVHGIFLETVCSHCKKNSFPLSSHCCPGRCSNCGKWLGSADGVANDSDSNGSAELAIAKIASTFLERGPEALEAGGPSAFPENITTLKHSQFDGSTAATCRFLNVSRETLLAWERGTHSPRLLSLADVSHRLDISPEGLLSEKLDPAELRVEVKERPQLHRTKPATAASVDYEAVRSRLTELVADDVAPPRSMTKIAESLLCRPMTLKKRFSELYEILNDRYHAYQREARDERSKILRSKVRAAVTHLHHSGVYPSQNRVRTALSGSVDMRDPDAHAEWKRMLCELGYQGSPTVGSRKQKRSTAPDCEEVIQNPS